MKGLKTILISLLLSVTGLVCAQRPAVPKYEYRAVWLTTIENLDWPSTQGSTPPCIEEQKRELCVILDSLSAMNVNTVMLQTRVRGDLIYPSEIEPYSKVFTGWEGKYPGYDPLAFAIEECHRRGMQLHAWLVTMPLGNDVHVRSLGSRALPRRKPSLCTRYHGSWYMEPGNPETSDYIVSIVKEIVSGYDVDGIHLDYVRYPDRNDGYPDRALYRKYGKGLSLADWRRSNITRIVGAVYSCVKELKPWVRVSCAPLGKHDNLTRYSSLGWDARNVGFQDAQQWMRDGIIDMVFPMLYFDGNNFYPFVLDWKENSFGRHVVPGIGIYRLLPQYGGWNTAEIVRQLRTSRAAGTDGTAMFRSAHLTGNSAGAYDAYAAVYRTAALVPPMEWHGTKPATPATLSVGQSGTGYRIQWSGVKAGKGHPAVRYNVYGAVGHEVDIDNPLNLLAVMTDSLSFDWHCRLSHDVCIAVTAVDAYGVESEPALLVHTEPGIFENEILLPAASAPGMRIEVLDIYGRRIYEGRYVRRVGVRGLCDGYYTLNVYDRHGALCSSRRFTIGRRL